MQPYLYLCLTPEALVASMLPPQEFGTYLATGTQKRPHGQAMFFQVSEDLPKDVFSLDTVEQRCVPHEDGRPKHSLYLSIYRVLEHVPLDAIQNLYLVTAHGKVLEIARGELANSSEDVFHLYQEICPVRPAIATRLGAAEFCKLITDPSRPIHVPKLCFADMDLEGLASDPDQGESSNLPYGNLDHLRSCLTEVKPLGSKETKTVSRSGLGSFMYRCIKTGLYVGDQSGLVYYPYPTLEQREKEYYDWWRCATDNELNYISPLF